MRGPHSVGTQSSFLPFLAWFTDYRAPPGGRSAV
jgi:hypothetical protein